MQHKGKQSLLATSIAMALSSSIALAQTPEDAESEVTEEEIEVISVTGTRGNLFNAQNMKREAPTVLDALSAADMGALPDRSVLEAMSRMPGISIERFAAANDPDHFGVEGGGVAVRGLTHVRSEFNGRDAFTVNSGRSLSFEDVSPELMGSVEVFKNQTADMVEGGIAGTVSLNTRKPFDSDGRVIAFSVDATYGDERSETTPTFSGLYSDVFELDSGKYGVLFNYSNSEIKARSDGTQVGLFEEQNRLVNGKPVYVPRSTRLTRKDDDRDREGIAMSLQWESPDRTMVATGEFIQSKADLAWTEHAIEFDDGAMKDLVSPDGNEFQFGSDGYFESGVISSDAGWRGNDPDRQPGGIFGAQHTMVTRARNQEQTTRDYSFNLKYTPNDTWAFQYDIQYVDAESDILDVSVMGATRAVVGFDISGGGIPEVSFHDPAYDGDMTHFTDPHQNFYRSAMDHVSDNDGDELATRFDVEYTLDNGFFSKLATGVRYAKRDQTTRESTYNWGFISEAWSGDGGNAWYDGDRAATVPYDQVSFAGFGGLTVDGGNSFLFPSTSLVQNYSGLADALSPMNPGWSPLANREGAVGHFIPNEINETEETSKAIYVRADFEGNWGDMDYSGNIGLRYVDIENDTAGFTSYPDHVADPDRPDDPHHFLPDDQKAFGNAASEEVTASSNYDTVLPSFNLKLNLTDEWLVRFGYSQAIALPDLGNLRNYVSIDGEDLITEYDPDTPPGEEPVPVGAYYDRYTASSGNPYLQPMESDNYDLSFEWYFAGDDVGSLTFAFFYKDLENYFINDVTFREYSNNGATQVVEVAGATNGDEGRIKGFEVAYQQFYDSLPGIWSGLGTQINYTYIDENGSPNNGLSPDHPDSGDAGDIAFDDLPLEGLSKDNFNIAVLYEKYGINARVAYNWRSDYLLTTRDVITSLPIYNENMGQLDASLFYDINENWTVGIQGTNLTDSEVETTMQVDEDGTRKPRSFFVYDRRYSFVIRGKF